VPALPAVQVSEISGKRRSSIKCLLMAQRSSFRHPNPHLAGRLSTPFSRPPAGHRVLLHCAAALAAP
jgi:hypothetical protein